MLTKMMISAAALLLAVVGATSAEASTFVLDFTQVGTPSNGCCGPFDVSATIQATQVGDNYDITSISGTVTQNGTPYAITGLIPASSDPGGYFGFDNVILGTATGGPYSLDTNGIAFYSNAIYNFYPSDPSATFNIWGNGGSSGTLGTTASYDVNTSFDGTYSITAVPEPATWAMLVLGVAGIGASLRRRNLALAAA